MKILSEMTGSAENRIVYERDGVIGVFRRPSGVPLGEMRDMLRRTAGTAGVREIVPDACSRPEGREAKAAGPVSNPVKKNPAAGSSAARDRRRRKSR